MEKLTASNLKKYTNESTLWRGQFLEADDGVKNFSIYLSETEGRRKYLELFATVRGSSKKEYKVNAALEAESRGLYAAYCECIAFEKYDGLCKHCVALLMHYLNDEEKYLDELHGQGYALEKRKTDRSLRTFLQKYNERERSQLFGNLYPGLIHLEPTISLQGPVPKISLKIGRDKMYVVRDINALVRHVRDNENFSYGKNLSFVHSMDSFDEKSVLLMDFFMRHIDYNPFYNEPAIRYFELGAADFDEIIDLTASDGILMLSDSKNAPSLWKLSDEPFAEKLTITGCRDGALLRCEAVRCISSRKYYYFLKNNVIYRRERKKRHEADELRDFLSRSRTEDVFISDDDLPLFVREVLPAARKNYDVVVKDIDLDKFLPEEADFDIYLDMPQDNMVTCDLIASYGEDRVFHVFEGVPEQGARNVPQELRAQNSLMQYFNAFDDVRHQAVLADDEDMLFVLLTQGVQQMQTWARVFVSDRLKRITEIKRPQISVGVSLESDLLKLKVSSENIPLDELAAILSRYDKRKKFIRLKDGSFFSTEDENLNTLSQIQSGLMLSGKDLAKGEVAVPKFRALFLDAQLKENSELPVSKNRDFKALIRNMHNAQDSDYEVPKALSKILREYQKTGYSWIETLYANGFGGILADDMGLGKTLQVITFLYAEYERRKEGELRALVVTPASLVYNWEDEFKRFAPELPVFTAAGSAKEREEFLKALPERAVVVTSYDLLKRDIEKYRDIKFEFQILDEAQFIKNAGTKAAHGVKMVNSAFRLALTGTPVENRLSELWSIFDYLMPGYLFSYQKFKSEIETPVVLNNDQDALKRIQKMIAPFVLRRLKKDVLRDLPDKIERNMSARMEGEQKKLYDAHVQRLKLFLDKQAPEEFDKSKIQILSELTKLRQLCCDPSLMYENYAGGAAKLDLCLELVKNAVEGNHKIIIFSQFTSMLERIAKKLEDSDIRFYMLTGSTSKQERIRLVNLFNQNDVPVFCISLKAGGTGLNLTAADIVIHYDPWWNTAAQNQATDRTHRIGQKNVVTVYKLIAKDSIEENIVKLQDKKQELADAVLSGTEGGMAAFSKEELLKLLSS